MRTKTCVVAVAAIVIIAAAVALFVFAWPASSLRLVARAAYSCDGGRTISAAFYKSANAPPWTPGEQEPPQPGGQVALILSDGRSVTLPQTISADGGRYANTDESLVFWSKGYGAFVTEDGTTTYANCLETLPTQLFVNPDGGYSFNVPSIWHAAINAYNNNNSLFGPDASDTSGLGGVEVFPNQKSVGDFLAGVSARYSNQTAITVGGYPALKVDYAAPPMGSGEQVVIFRDGTVYNLYIGSMQSDDQGYFEELVSSFKFTK